MFKIISVLILFPFLILAQSVNLPAPAKIRQPVIHPQIESLGLRENGRIHAWIYFRDKGIKTEDFNHVLARAEDHLTERCRWRRLKRGSDEVVSFRDIPVYQPYISQVLSIGPSLRRVSRWFNAISISANRQQLEEISKLSCVAKIDPVLLYKRSISMTGKESRSPNIPKLNIGRSDSLDYGNAIEQIQQINCQFAHEEGYTGKGVIVLMLDTGYYKDHESIQQDSIIAEWDFINNDGNTQNEEGDPYYQHNHGTYTLSALGGYKSGSLIGPAFEARFILAKTEIVDEEIQQEEDNYVAALEWGESLGADVASSSLGYLDWYTYGDLDGNTAVTTKAVDIAVSQGMVCVTAAGNEGNVDWYYIIAPADADSVISVGAVNSEGEIASFSSHGPTYDGRTKPEVCARGVATACASPKNVNLYASVNGTSLATPLVSGSVAVILSAHPDWTPVMVREALMNTASHADNPDNTYGWGIIDVWAAINYDSFSVDTETPLPTEFYLSQNYPNPFNASTTIHYALPANSYVSLKIFNILGEEVVTLENDYRETQVYSIEWDAGNYPSGIYFLQLHARQPSGNGQNGDFIQTRKMILLK